MLIRDKLTSITINKKFKTKIALSNIICDFSEIYEDNKLIGNSTLCIKIYVNSITYSAFKKFFLREKKELLFDYYNFQFVNSLNLFNNSYFLENVSFNLNDKSKSTVDLVFSNTFSVALEFFESQAKQYREFLSRP